MLAAYPFAVPADFVSAKFYLQNPFLSLEYLDLIVKLRYYPTVNGIAL